MVLDSQTRIWYNLGVDGTSTQTPIGKGKETVTMTKQEMKQAMVLARDPNRNVGRDPLASTTTDLVLFDGFGLHGFQPVHVTLQSVASLINWQALQFNGEYDPIALGEIAECGRKKFIIIG
jgi:hypothetical protein